MPVENYVLIERTELNASAASVTFASIPQSGYTDLKIVASSRDTNTGAYWSNIFLTFNNNTANYSTRLLGNADGSAVSATSGSSTYIQYGYSVSPSSTASTFSNTEIYIPNYTGNTNKSVSIDSVTENNGTQILLSLAAGLWSNTAAITSITLTAANSSSFTANSTFSLYGIAALGTTPAIAPKADGGNIIDYDGTYWIHTFTSSGTFTPQTGLTCDYLVVAGGGGGAREQGGGGGAGGLRSTVTATGGGGSLESALSLSAATNYAVTIGAGGTGATSSASRGNIGNNSVFSTITSNGGGGGGSQGSSAGQDGGSGGGGARTYTAGGAGTANQGYAGGIGTSSASFGCGGGGGAGAIGGAGTTTVGGNGGNGVATVISGTSVTYAGGGGGGIYGTTGAGAGGTGGGGAGAIGVNATSGTANTGGGGGGTGQNSSTSLIGNGGNGGAGIVIIRYPAA
jgi:hypothetical protein